MKVMRIRKHILYFFILFTANITFVSAQLPKLKIGDTLPDVFLPEILKHTQESANLSEFRDKAILIDFWFTNCTACIAKFPFLDSISKEFNEDLHVLQVTKDSKQKVETFFTSSERWKHINFPCVVNDTVMNALFPHLGEPYYIWIGKDGIVKAMTDGTAVNRENISTLIRGEHLELLTKEENPDKEQFWGLNPLMLDYPDVKDDLLSYSFFAKSKGNGFRASLSDVNPVYNPKNNHYRLRQMGTTFNRLYSTAYGLLSRRDYHPSRIVREDVSKEEYTPSFDSNNRHNVYDYDLIVGYTSIATFFMHMQADLDKYFNVRSSFVKREIEVFVIKEHDSGGSYKSTDLNGFREQYVDGELYVAKNIPINAFMRMLNTDSPIFPYQILNETGYTGQISIEVNTDLSDMEKVRKSFQRYGLDLLLEKREMDIILIQ